MKYIEMDIESFSSADLSKSGVYRYAESDDFEVLLFGYSVDGGEVQVVDLAQGEKIPQSILDALTDNSVKKYAYNAAFERVCLSRYLGYPTGEYLNPDSWYCIMVWAATMGLPFSLEKVGEALGIEKQKLTEGKELIKMFCVPCEPSLANGMKTRLMPKYAKTKWELFKEYNKRDVEAEMQIKQKLCAFPVKDSEWDNYHLDQRINDLGIALDMDFVDSALVCDETNSAIAEEKARDVTGIDNPNSPAQLKAWLAERGQTVESLSKSEVARLLKDATGNVEEILKLRQELAKSSVKKYTAMKNCVCSDGRARGLIQFYGANRTGRYSSKIIQLQNLPKTSMPALKEAREAVKAADYAAINDKYGNVSGVLSELIRTAFVPKAGCRFIVSDFSAIEARVIAWFAGEEWRNRLFAAGGDIYCMSASQMFKVPVEKNGVNGHLRQKGKIAELACIAEDQLALTDQGLIPIQSVTTDMKLWDGEEWVAHDGVIFKGIKEVITYDGLTATADHLVWVEGQSRPIQFGIAAANGARLVKTADVGNTAKPCSGTARVYDIRNAGKNNRFTVSGRLVHNCGYGGSVGALKAMGATAMGIKESELKPLVTAWRQANPNITKFWWAVDRATKYVVSHRCAYECYGLAFSYEKGVLFIRLPSGRRLAYIKPRIGINNFGSECVTYEGLGTGRKWERIESYGPKFVENCLAEGTLVLTDRGLVKIEDIQADDRIWDGEEWVSHDGLIYQGEKDTVIVGTLHMTADHKILTTNGWVKCNESKGLDWAAVSLPDSFRTRGEHETRESSMAVPMCVRESEDCFRKGADGKEISAEIMRLYEQTTYKQSQFNTRNESSLGVGGMAFNETAMRESEPSSIPQLWCKRDNGMSGMESKFRAVLAGYGCNISKRAGIGSDRQQQGIQSEQLSLDDQENQQQEQAHFPHGGNSARLYDDCRAVRENGNRSYNSYLSIESQLADRISVRPCGLKERVYDIRNCGPRHRFAVSDDGKLRIVSNCVQATARDILAEAMQRLWKYGYRIVMHVHDEVVLEVPYGQSSVAEVSAIMSETPGWAQGLKLNADGYECEFYKKE